MFAHPSAVFLNKLLDYINDIRKDPSEDIARSIRAASDTCCSRHLINRLLAGLPHEYDNLKDAISLNRNLDMESLTESLLETEARLSVRSRHRSLSPARPNRDERGAPARPRPTDTRYPDRFRPLDSYQDRPPFRPRWCTHCGKSGHAINNYWKLFPKRRCDFAPRGHTPRPLPSAPPHRPTCFCGSS